MMNSEQTTQAVPRIAVVGASGAVGREVARLAVAYGCDVTGLCRAGIAPVDEPWTHGVEWTRFDSTRMDEFPIDFDELDAIVDASPMAVRGAIARRVSIRTVEIGCASEIQPASLPGKHVVHLISPPFIEAVERGESAPSEHGIALSHAAMAALRAALEEDHAGIVDPSQVAILGDAMFLQ